MCSAHSLCVFTWNTIFSPFFCFLFTFLGYSTSMKYIKMISFLSSSSHAHSSELWLCCRKEEKKGDVNDVYLPVMPDVDARLCFVHGIYCTCFVLISHKTNFQLSVLFSLTFLVAERTLRPQEQQKKFIIDNTRITDERVKWSEKCTPPEKWKGGAVSEEKWKWFLIYFI